MAGLLAVDMGLSTGLALYGGDGRLIWYRSQNFGTADRLRRAVPAFLSAQADLQWIVLEGGGPLATIWQRAAERRGISYQQIAAERWREQLLYARQQRHGEQAKQHAMQLARRVISWSDAPKPTALRHDTAEAILVGLWAVLDKGWLAELPTELRP